VLHVEMDTDRAVRLAINNGQKVYKLRVLRMLLKVHPSRRLALWSVAHRDINHVVRTSLSLAITLPSRELRFPVALRGHVAISHGS
jgi:hypothetical protein